MSGFRIRSLSAWVIIDADDDESLPAAFIFDHLVPLVAADEARLRILRPFAEAVGRRVGKPVRLIRFTVREELEVIEPKPKES